MPASAHAKSSSNSKSTQSKPNRGSGSDVNSLQKEVRSTLKRLEQKDPGLKRFLEDAYGYAVFPNVGKAALVIGGAYGKGLVFKKGEPIGHATIAQTTIGVQVGGDTFSQIIAFESKESLERFKQGKLAFAANASAVLVKAGAAATADYEKGVSVFAYATGGMLLEAAIGGQKFKFKPLDGRQPSGGKDSGRSQTKSNRQQEQDGEQGQEGKGLLGRAMQGVGGTTSKMTGLVKQHPVATLLGAGLIGLALLALRSARSSGAAQQDEPGGGEQDEQPQDDYDQQQDEDEDQDDPSQGEMDYDEEQGDEHEEEEEAAPRRSRR
jgi:lipid-binding SYLF domain-containing protein